MFVAQRLVLALSELLKNPQRLRTRCRVGPSGRDGGKLFQWHIVAGHQLLVNEITGWTVWVIEPFHKVRSAQAGNIFEGARSFSAGINPVNAPLILAGTDVEGREAIRRYPAGMFYHEPIHVYDP